MDEEKQQKGSWIGKKRAKKKRQEKKRELKGNERK